MSSSGGSISSYIGSKWATLLVGALLASGGLAAAVVTGDAGECLASEDCFPKPQNTGLGATGIPDGTSLSSCGTDDTLSTNNEVVEGCEWTGTVTVTGSNVTIRDSRIHGRIHLPEADTTASYTIEDSEIGPDSGCFTFAQAVGVHRYTARRVYLHNVADGFRVAEDDVTIEDSFVSLCSTSGEHSDGVQGLGADRDNTINHNTIDQSALTADETAPVFFADGSSSVTLTDNLLIARSTSHPAIRLHDDATPDIGPWIATGNRIIGTVNNANTECGAGTTTWSDNRTVTIDGAYEITSTGSAVTC